MEELRLSPRLAAIAALVPDSAYVADVGTDHGLLPIYLMRRGIVRLAIGTDISEGPLETARSNAALYGETRVRFMQGDGLECVRPEEVNTIVLAGMGGETIAEILSKTPWVRNGAMLILQPMSRAEKLRRALYDMSLMIMHEELVEDVGRIYPVLVATAGVCDEYSEAEYYTGLYSQICADPLFPRYLRHLTGRLNAAAEGLAQSGREEDASRLAALRQVLAGLRDMQEALNEDG